MVQLALRWAARVGRARARQRAVRRACERAMCQKVNPEHALCHVAREEEIQNGCCRLSLAGCNVVFMRLPARELLAALAAVLVVVDARGVTSFSMACRRNLTASPQFFTEMPQTGTLHFDSPVRGVISIVTLIHSH